MAFWIDLEGQLNQSIPVCVKRILENSGFDSEMSLLGLNEESLVSVESFAQKSLQHLIKQLNCCHSEIYRNQTEFQFIPGHKSLILKIPEKLELAKKLDSRPVSLSALCQHMIDRISDMPMTSTLFNEFLKTVVMNENRAKTRFRYTEIIRSFSMYIYMLCGRNCYEILSSNLPIPDSSTILKYIHEHKKKIIEGKLRCEELSVYLEKINAPKIVWLSEDGTGINSKVVYDSSTNQLVGIVLPLDGKGMPICLSFRANSINDIESHMEKSKSSLAYIIMAQPIKAKSAPFVLQIFGTDNRFSASDVLNRWKFTESELKKVGISVLGISADGDSRLLRSMKIMTPFEINPLLPHDYSRLQSAVKLYSQDTTHIGTKLRNRLLKPSILLPFGNRQISVAHLKIMISSVPKNIHGITYNDVSPDDRQNYGSLEKIMKPRVTEALEKYVTGSEGTVAYIKICDFVTSSFLDGKLKPLERIFRIWYSVFFLRAWKKWLVEREYDLADNFISSNAFECIEINAYCLLGLVVRLRESNQPKLFQTKLFDSQTCERTFRQMRSMSTMNYTRINFSINELLHLIQRVELQSDIIFNKLDGMGIVFPRIQIENALDIAADIEIKMPSNEEIVNVVEDARSIALKDIIKFDINVNGAEIVQSEVKVRNILFSQDITDTDEQDDLYTESDAEDNESSNELGIDRGKEDRDDISGNPDNKYITVCDEDGREKWVRKSSIVWVLQEPTKKLSNDRLKRVQMVSSESANTTNSNKNKRARTTNQQACQQVPLNENLILNYYRELHVGQWALCWLESQDENWDINWGNISVERFETLVRSIVIGVVLGFQYTNGNTKKDREYRLDSALITNDPSIKRVNILASWYKIEENGNLCSFNRNNYFINSQQFIGTVEEKFVVIDPNKKKLTVDVFQIKEKLQTKK